MNDYYDVIITALSEKIVRMDRELECLRVKNEELERELESHSQERLEIED